MYIAWVAACSWPSAFSVALEPYPLDQRHRRGRRLGLEAVDHEDENVTQLRRLALRRADRLRLLGRATRGPGACPLRPAVQFLGRIAGCDLLLRALQPEIYE